MNNKISYIAVLLLLIVSSCDTTRHIPDDEQLYTGMLPIDYADRVTLHKKKSSDSTGVITAVANAVDAASQLFTSGNTQALASAIKKDPKTMTKEEKAEAKRLDAIEKQAFETAQTEVEAVLACKPNNSIFGSSYHRWPWPVGLWFHSGFYGKKGKVNQWIFKTFAANPVLISTVNPTLRTQIATNTLQSYGYLSGQVSAEVVDEKKPKRAKVAYTVMARKLYRYDNIEYRGFSPHTDSLLHSVWDERLLKKDDGFSALTLNAERERINSLFRDNGYYYYQPEYITFKADTVARQGWVQLRVEPMEGQDPKAQHKWYIGKSDVTVYNSRMEPLDSCTKRRSFTYHFSGKKAPVRTGVILRNLQRRGTLYSQSEHLHRLEDLNSTGLFSNLTLDYIPRDTAQTCDTLDILMQAVLSKPYDAEFELKAMMRNSNQIGPGAVFGLTRHNAFRQAEKVTFQVHGSYEWQTRTSKGDDQSLLNSYEYGTTLTFDFPRLFMPGVNRRKLPRLGSTQFSLDATLQTRANYFTMVDMSLGATYSWYNNRKTLHHELTPLSLRYNNLITTSTNFDSIMAANKALAVSMRSQFIPSIRYTLTYSHTDSYNPYYWQTTIAESGNATSAIYALCGKGFNVQDKELFGNPFSQFLKLTTEYHKTINLSHGQKIAARATAGVLFAYGNSNTAPYSEQFFVGGANSIRAFALRSLGPGSYHPNGQRYSYLDQTGDLKFEANIEYRRPLFGDLHGAVFVDAGNVWLMKDDPQRPGGQFKASNFFKELALGTGFGLRYDMQFLVIRLDLGIALHAPYDTGKSGYYNIPSFGDGLGFHFAVGYPF